MDRCMNVDRGILTSAILDVAGMRLVHGGVVEVVV